MHCKRRACSAGRAAVVSSAVPASAQHQPPPAREVAHAPFKPLVGRLVRKHSTGYGLCIGVVVPAFDLRSSSSSSGSGSSGSSGGGSSGGGGSGGGGLSSSGGRCRILWTSGTESTLSRLSVESLLQRLPAQSEDLEALHEAVWEHPDRDSIVSAWLSFVPSPASALSRKIRPISAQAVANAGLTFTHCAASAGGFRAALSRLRAGGAQLAGARRGEDFARRRQLLR